MLALLVDDSRAMRSMLRSIVSKLGFEILEAEHGQAALDIIEAEGPPDLMLVDWNMPVMTGIELVRHLRADEIYESVRIVMVTSQSEVDSMVAALESGADEYVMKPFEKDELVALIGRLGIGAISEGN